MLVCVRDKKIVGAFHVVVEPGVDFYSAFRASEFRPLKVLQVEADCSRVNQFQIFFFFSFSFSPQKLVVVEKMKIEFLKNIARLFFICVRKVRPRDIRPYARMIEVVVACNCVLN